MAVGTFFFLFIISIFVVACGALCGLWLLLKDTNPQHPAKAHKKPLLSNWK
jgi:hypothetical protein